MQRAIPLILIASCLIAVIAIGALRSHRTWPDPVEQLRQFYANKPVSEEDIYSFRLKAAPQLAALIRDRNVPKTIERRVQKVQAGCGL
jgi:hypothetical protein